MHKFTVISKVILLIALGAFLFGCANITRDEYQYPKNKVVRTGHGRYSVQPVVCNAPVPWWVKADQVAVAQWGCSTSRNLALMIANPKDLVKPERTYTHPSQPLVRAQDRVLGNQGGSAAAANK